MAIIVPAACYAVTLVPAFVKVSEGSNGEHETVTGTVISTRLLDRLGCPPLTLTSASAAAAPPTRARRMVCVVAAFAEEEVFDG